MNANSAIKILMRYERYLLDWHLSRTELRKAGLCGRANRSFFGVNVEYYLVKEPDLD
jgi:hypothetical protein